jgi:hypothetical protein
LKEWVEQKVAIGKLITYFLKWVEKVGRKSIVKLKVRNEGMFYRIWA